MLISQANRQSNSNNRRSSGRLSVGDRKKNMVKSSLSTFASFADAEEEEQETLAPSTTPPKSPAPINLFPALFNRDTIWSDLLEEESTTLSIKPLVQHAAGYYHLPQTRLNMDDLFLPQNRFAINLELVDDNSLDITGLCHPEWCALMTWLYAAGWIIDPASETHFMGHDAPLLIVRPADLPPRIWVEPEECVRIQVAPSASSQPKAAKKPVVIPRFCRAAASCEDATCRYVHGDTIPRLNEPCGFGAACGASDPTGVKRSQCLRIHPGETWTPNLVITRPCCSPV